MLRIAVSNQQSRLAIDEERLKRAVAAILADAGFTTGSISLAIVDDATIRDLHRRYLDDDTPTDVLSFPLEVGQVRIEAEIVASADTAIIQATNAGWAAENELLLYVIHGALHLAGFDDRAPDDAARMRAAEARWLKDFGIDPPRGHCRVAGAHET